MDIIVQDEHFTHDCLARFVNSSASTMSIKVPVLTKWNPQNNAIKFMRSTNLFDHTYIFYSSLACLHDWVIALGEEADYERGHVQIADWTTALRMIVRSKAPVYLLIIDHMKNDSRCRQMKRKFLKELTMRRKWLGKRLKILLINRVEVPLEPIEKISAQ